MEQKTMKCIKCHKDVLVQNGVNSPKGFVCNDCIKKEKSKKTVIITGCILLLAIVGVVIYFVQSKKNSGVGFEGVNNIQDSVSVSIQQPVATFSIDKAVAKANPVIAGQTIDNIESFKRVFAENVQKAKETNKGSVIIPNVSLMFNFSSSSISSKSDELLKEYSKAYLQTNVQQALMLAGIPENKIEVKWYGKSRFNEFNYSSKSEYRRVILSIK